MSADHQEQAASRDGRVGRLLSYILVLSVATCVLTELGARLAEKWFVGIPEDGAFYWHKSDPYLGWRNDSRSAARVGLPIEESGYQIYRGTKTKPDAPTILCLGDSGTFGIWTDGEIRFKSYAEFLAEKLSCTVVNAGTVGYTSWHCVRVLRQYDGPLDAIVVRVGWNDHAHGNPMRLDNADSKVAAWLNTFAVGRLVLLSAQRPQPTDKPSVSLDEFANNLRTMVRIARERNVALYFVDYPTRLTQQIVENAPLYLHIHKGVAHSLDDLQDVHRRYIGTAREVAEASGVHFVDTPLSEDQFSPVDAVHPNAEGAEHVAAFVAQAIVADGAIGIRPAARQ
ncbi:MAG: SGNH/GDSL hydrolase family protein [Candidatus Hydrogenedentes bacterium]|nr:SGNH/GDSL hydrolase family protein [Candidatus Hydrogenedentota bacterium]